MRPRDRACLHQPDVARALEQADEGRRRLATGAYDGRAPARALAGGEVAPDLERVVVGARQDRRTAESHAGEVGLVDAALGEGVGEGGVGTGAAREHDHAAGVPVEAVDEGEVPRLAVALGEQARQGGDEVVAVGVDRRVADEPRRFVHREHLRVLVQDAAQGHRHPGTVPGRTSRPFRGKKRGVGGLLSRCSDPGFTPGERDVVPLLAEWATARDETGDKELDQRVAKALGRGGRAVMSALLGAFDARPSNERVVRLRAIGRIVGRIVRRGAEPVEGAEGLDAVLRTSLGGEPVVVREAARVVAKLPEGTAAGFEPALLDIVRHAELPERRAAVDALGRVGTAAALEILRGLVSSVDDADLDRRLGEAIVLLERRASRTAVGRIRLDRALPTAQSLVLRYRSGVASVVREQLAARCDRQTAPSRLPTELTVDWDGTLGHVYRVRTALDVGFRFPLPPAPSATARVVTALSDEAVIAALSAWTEGRIRFRLAWAGRGHRRAVTWSVARALAERGLPVTNDSREALWTVEVDEARGHLDCRPSFDPRFAYRRADVPAASHPTLAATLAWVAAPEPGMTVWDPFCGSGLELIECAHLADDLRLLGTDLEPRALVAVSDNVSAAGLSNAELSLERGDATSFCPSGPVARIITNPPMGRRVAGTEDLARLLRRFIEHAARWLEPGGTLTWLSPRPATTARIAASLGLRVEDRSSVDMGGFAAGLQVFVAP